MKGYVIEKEFEHKGLKCVVLLLAIGHRCGYVGVPKEHPLYNVDEMNCLSDFSCHGGLTYSGGGENSSYPISSDLWWFGFDCAHCADEPDWNSTLKAFPEQYKQIYQQKMIGKMFHSEGKIRTTEYVENECKALAEQLANYEGYKTSSDEQEGFVINIDGYKVKLKYNDYVHIHKVLSKLSSINLVISSIADGCYDDLLSKLPKAYHENVKKIATVVMKYINETTKNIKQYYDDAPKTNKKDFMIYVSENVPKEYQVYCRELYYGHDINVLKSGNKKSPRYKKLKEMGVDDYSVLFKEELKDV